MDREPVVEQWATGIGAITLFVEDLDEARRFYQQVFELPVVFEDDESAVFRFGGTLVNLLRTTAADELVAPARGAPSAAGARVVYSIEVDDVDALGTRLAERGVELLN